MDTAEAAAARPLKPASHRIPALDGVRGLAVVAVVAYHAEFLKPGWGPRLVPGAFIGVDLFFVLSGFLITSVLLDEQDETGRIALGRFEMRRLRRLAPALVCCCLAVVAVLWAADWLVEGANPLGVVAATVLYVSNYVQAADAAYPDELSHTWSLAIEAQFYLVWPLVLIAARRLRLSSAALVWILVATCVAVWVHRASMWTDQENYLPLYLRTDTRIDTILAGCILAVAVRQGWLNGRSWVTKWGPLALAFAYLVAVSTLSETGDVRLYRNGGLAAVTVAASVVVASALFSAPSRPMGRFWTLRPLRALGDRSYSLYLWHVPVFVVIAYHYGSWPVAVKIAVGLVAAGVLTELSYRFVESRFRARRREVSREAATTSAT